MSSLLPPSPDWAAVGQRVRRWREARGWTQVELAAAAGINDCTVSHLESGHGLQVYTLWRICGALSKDPNALLGITPDQTRQMRARARRQVEQAEVRR